MNLSQIRNQGSGIWKVPSYFVEDYYADYITDHHIQVIEQKGNSYLGPSTMVSWKILAQLREESYSACVWYNCLEKKTIPSKFLTLGVNWKYDIEKYANEKSLTFPSFIKLDTVSPKDVHSTCIFSNKEELIKAFQSSTRVIVKLEQKKNYLFVRLPTQLHIEMRCFVYHRKLVAISCSNVLKHKKVVREHIADYMHKEIIPDLPYTDAVLDLSYDPKTGQCLVIEINEFGADSSCGSGMFNWHDDYLQLHGGMPEIELRDGTKLVF